jgi:hypothetical protein
VSFFQEREQRVEEIEVGSIDMLIGHVLHYNNALDNPLTARASFRHRRFRYQATMAFTLKDNGTAHSVVVDPDTIAAQVEGRGALRSHGCGRGWFRGDCKWTLTG